MKTKAELQELVEKYRAENLAGLPFRLRNDVMMKGDRHLAADRIDDLQKQLEVMEAKFAKMKIIFNEA